MCKFEDVEVKTYARYLKCDKCDCRMDYKVSFPQGFMTKYKYVCPQCGKEELSDCKFPITVYTEVEK